MRLSESEGRRRRSWRLREGRVWSSEGKEWGGKCEAGREGGKGEMKCGLVRGGKEVRVKGILLSYGEKRCTSEGNCDVQ